MNKPKTLDDYYKEECRRDSNIGIEFAGIKILALFRANERMIVDFRKELDDFKKKLPNIEN